MIFRRNKNLAENDPRRLMHTQTIQQNNESFDKYTRIVNLQTRITRLRQDHRPRILQCHNCNRRSPSNAGLHPMYQLTYHAVNSSNVRKRATFKHIISSSGQRETTYTLCNQCNEYLVEKNTLGTKCYHILQKMLPYMVKKW